MARIMNLSVSTGPSLPSASGLMAAAKAITVTSTAAVSTTSRQRSQERCSQTVQGRRAGHRGGMVGTGRGKRGSGLGVGSRCGWRQGGGGGRGSETAEYRASAWITLGAEAE